MSTRDVRGMNFHQAPASKPSSLRLSSPQEAAQPVAFSKNLLFKELRNVMDSYKGASVAKKIKARAEAARNSRDDDGWMTQRYFKRDEPFFASPKA